MKSTSLLAAVICSSTLSLSAHAALIDHGTYITDTVAGLDWLKLTETAGRTYDDVSAKFGTGEEFEGWAYGTRVQFAHLLWGAGIYNAGLPPKLNEIPLGNSYLQSTNAFTPWDFIVLMGEIDPYPPQWDGLRSTGLLADVVGSNYGFAHMFSYYDNSYEDNKLSYGGGTPVLNCGACSYQSQTSVYGSYLVRISDVPVPGAIYLFGSAILGLAGARLRRKV
jgi:hypothetical protein